MNSQKLNLENIAGIQEIDDVAAANYNGGSDLEMWTNANRTGELVGVDFNAVEAGNVYNLSSSLTNELSSIKVNNGSWKFYDGSNGAGDYITLNEGEYLLSSETGDWNDRIGSFELLST